MTAPAPLGARTVHRQALPLTDLYGAGAPLLRICALLLRAEAVGFRDRDARIAKMTSLRGLGCCELARRLRWTVSVGYSTAVSHARSLVAESLVGMDARCARR